MMTHPPEQATSLPAVCPPIPESLPSRHLCGRGRWCVLSAVPRARSRGPRWPRSEISVGTRPTAALTTDCAAFASFEEAQAYYAANPGAQPNLDPNGDGRACEIFFGVDAPAAPVPAGVGVAPSGGGCDPSYPGVCIPPAPPDLDCGQIGFRRFQVLSPDPHGFDGDGDGIGCESG